MNKYQEALEHLRMLEREYRFKTTNQVAPQIMSDIIQELVELATPKKPIYLATHYMYESYEVNYQEFECPTCGEIHVIEDDEGVPYCWKCGQKLDWGEDDE